MQLQKAHILCNVYWICNRILHSSCACLLVHSACSGCVFRTAAPIHASELDTKKLYNDLGIKDLVRHRP
jgi:hypothetical protein